MQSSIIGRCRKSEGEQRFLEGDRQQVRNNYGDLTYDAVRSNYSDCAFRNEVDNRSNKMRGADRGGKNRGSRYWKSESDAKIGQPMVVKFVGDDEFFDSEEEGVEPRRGGGSWRNSAPLHHYRRASTKQDKTGGHAKTDDDDHSDLASRRPVKDRRRSPVGGRKQVQPDRFDGAGTTDLSSYLDHFEACADHNEWNKREMAIQLRLSLRNKAARAVRTEDGQRLSYEEMVGRLKRRFGVYGHEVRYRNELRTRKRRANESIQDVADAIMSLLEAAYSNLDVDILGVEYFLEALGDEELVTRIRDHCPRDYEHAVSMAIQFESYTKSKSVDNVSRPKYEGRVRAAHVESEEDRIVAASALEHRPVVRCSNCGKGHPTNACWARGGANSHNAPYRLRQQRMTQLAGEIADGGQAVESRAGINPTGTAMAMIRCHLCNELGHRKYECKLLQAALNRLKEAPAVAIPAAAMAEAQASNNVKNARTANAIHTDIIAADETENILDVEQVLVVSDVHCQDVESFEAGQNCPGYLRMSYEGRSYAILLDSGCDISVFPAKMVNRQDLMPFTRNTIAANGSSIKILGQTVVELEANDKIFLARVLVSPNVLEPMLSRQWMRFNNCCWHYAQDHVIVRGVELPLENRSISPCIRRIVVEDETVLPPFSQTEVSARIELSHISNNNTGTAWATEVTVCKEGACVARAVYGEACNDVPVIVMNVTEQPITLGPGTVLSDLSPVECAEPVEVRSEAKLSEAIELIISKVDVSVTEQERQALRQVLYKYADVISLGEFDIWIDRLGGT